MNSSTFSALAARNLLAPLEADVIRCMQTLVQADTVAIPPDGKESAGQEVLRAFLDSFGVESESYATEFVRDSGHRMVRKNSNYTERLNLVATLSGSGRGRSLLFNGHMDTVPAGRTRWSESPWSGVVRDGRVYGRGSFDMKGGLAAQFAVLCAMKRAGLRLGGDVSCESVVDEEWGGGEGPWPLDCAGHTPTRVSSRKALRKNWPWPLAAGHLST